MINFKKGHLVALVAFTTLFSCEKDDICDGQAATPNVRIEFYDSANSANLKAFYKIECFVLPDNPNEPIRILEFFNRSEIQLPLNINSNQTVWNIELTQIINNDTIKNVDQLLFNYNPKIEYVSKACGYKTIFNDVNTSLNGNGIGFWITNFTPLTNNIINEENPHAKIYY